MNHSLLESGGTRSQFQGAKSPGVIGDHACMFSQLTDKETDDYLLILEYLLIYKFFYIFFIGINIMFNVSSY